MRPRSPRLLALCACLLLLTQVLPAAAVCRCDMPSKQGCCEETPAALAGHGCCNSAGTADADGSYAGPPCHRDLVDTFTHDATLPSGPTTVESHATTSAPVAEVTPTSSTVVLDAVEGPHHDAPPGTSAPPVYLRHACLLL